MGLRIATIGNIANNAYNMVKILRRRGLDAQLIDDGLDTFAFSRPMWEDVPLAYEYAQLGEVRAIQDWFEVERSHGWCPDDAVWRPGSLSSGLSGISLFTNVLRRVTRRGFGPNASVGCCDEDLLSPFAPDEKNFIRSNGVVHVDTIRRLKKCDVVIAFGVRAATCAYLADVPTIYFTYGGDIRVELMAKRKDLDVVSRVLQKMLRSPQFVIEAYGCDEEIHRILAQFNLLDKAEYAFLPNVNTALFSAPWDKGNARAELGWPENKTIFFMPSRIDRYWKASDRFIDAFLRISEGRDDLLLVITGWGSDYQYMHERLEGLDRADNVLILSQSVSKLLLKTHYAAADVVVDQFRVGSLGSVSFEALCMGKAVITHLAPFNLANYPHNPPLFNAQTGADIERAISVCIDDPDARDARGREAAKWYHAVYGEEHFQAVIEGVAEHGPARWSQVAGQQGKTLPAGEIPVPDSAGGVKVLDWPYPYRAGLTLSNDCEYYTWDDFCDIHHWLNGDIGRETSLGPALGLPVSDSFWFYSDDPENLGFSYFQGIRPGKLSVHAAQMAELIRAGILDVMHTYGGFDVTAGFTRRHVEVALEELDKISVVPAVWSNHGNVNNVQNLRGQYVGEYASGDRKGGGAYHADLTLGAGVKYFWLDAYSTNRFSLGNASGRGFVGGLAGEDTSLWGDRVLCRDILRDGQGIVAFRRFRGERGLAPDAENFGDQLSDASLKHLIESGGAAIIYQHLGCFRDESGAPHSRAGRPLPSATYNKFVQLSELYHDKRIWMATASVFIKYLDAVSSLRMAFRECADGVNLVLFKERGALKESDLRGVHLEFSNKAWQAVHSIGIENSDGSLQRCAHHRVSDIGGDRTLVFWESQNNPEFTMAL